MRMLEIAIWIGCSLCFCAAHFYIGKAQGAKEERDRIFGRHEDDE